MIHDLLFALNGFPGDLFVFNEDKSSLKISKNMEKHMLHPSETELLNRIAQLGWFYSKLISFIETHTGLLSQNSKGLTRNNIYLKTFSFGLDYELESYRESIISLENQLINSTEIMRLSSIEAELSEYFITLPRLVNLTQDIKKLDSEKVCILLALKQSLYCSIPALEAPMKRILQCCHGVLYIQMTNWMVYGLLDKEHDFFIQSVDIPEPAAQIQSQVTLEWDKFHVSQNFLPSYLTNDLASKILFIGNATKLLDENNNDNNLEKMRKKKINKMQRLEEYDCFCFEEAQNIIVDQYEAHSKLLWDLLMTKCNLHHHLQLLHNLFCLGVDDFFYSLIGKINKIMNFPLPNIEQEIPKLFQTQLNSITSSENLGDLFSLTYDEKKTNKFAFDKWTYAYLNYRIYNPALLLLFNSKAMNIYKNVFGFLISLKRVQVKLHENWLAMKKNRIRDDTPEQKYIWLQRSRMSFLIDQLNSYSRGDVVQCQFKILTRDIYKEENLENLKLVFGNYLSNIENQLFLQRSHVSRSFLDIFKICFRFCENQNDIKSQLSLIMDFDQQYRLLLKILNGLKHSSTVTSTFLLRRIDVYNN